MSIKELRVCCNAGVRDPNAGMDGGKFVSTSNNPGVLVLLGPLIVSAFASTRVVGVE